MQTSQAVSAGGLFTPGGVEISSPDHSAPTPPTVLADFEQHLQQSSEGQTELILALPAPAPEVEVKSVAATSVNPRGLAVPAAISFDAAQPPPNVVTVSRRPDQPAGGEPTAEAEPVTTVSPLKSEPREPEAPALELAAAAAVAADVPAAARMVLPPPQTPPPEAGREAGRESRASGPDVVPVEGEGRRHELPGRALTASQADRPASATSEVPLPAARRAAEAELRRSIDSARLPRPAVEPAPPAPTQPAPEGSPKPMAQPPLRQPATDGLRTPARAHATDRESGTLTDQPGLERVRIGRRAEGEMDSGRTGEVSRFQAGAEETAALNAAMFRRANMITLAGTAAAKSDHSMEKGLEQNQFAGLSEQKLPPPGRNALVAELRPRGERVLEPVRETAFDRTDKGVYALADGLAGRPGSLGGASSSTGGLEATSGSAVRTAEQLLQNLNREVAQFKRFNAESMAVVLKPDAQTEIFLHLASRNGQIEIQARFERGDFASLNGHWTQLQQTLSQQGVRLSNLQEGFQPPPQQSGGGPEWGQGQLPQGQQRQAGRDAENAPQKQAFDEFILRNSPTDAAQRPARAGTTVQRANSMLEAWA